MSNKPVKRNPNGTLAKGTGSANPGGRPKGIERRMREIIESKFEDWDGRRLDGWEAMTEMMYDVAMGRKPAGDLDLPITWKDRQAAVQFLFDRVHGKAKIQIESDTTLRPGGFDKIDIDSLDPAELDALEAHVELVAARAEGKAVGKVLDIDPSDVIEADLLDSEEES